MFPAGRGARGAPPSPEAVKAREDLRKWRLETPLDHFRNVRKKFDAAGLTIHAYCYNMNASFTDAEIDRGFEIAQALGTDVITTSTTLDVAKRMAPIADKHKITVGMHNHSNLSDPNEFATPESFAAAMKMSKYFKVNLDIGHFTAANYDPVAYIREHHAQHHQPAPEGPEEEPGRQRAVGHGRHADPRGAAAAEARAVADSRQHRVRIPRAGHAGRRGGEVLRVRETGARMIDSRS